MNAFKVHLAKYLSVLKLIDNALQLVLKAFFKLKYNSLILCWIEGILPMLVVGIEKKKSTD